jgi:hypothetical protein
MNAFLQILGRMLRDPGVFLAVLATFVGMALRSWQRLRRKIRGTESRNWPALTATIDIVSVVMIGSVDEVAGYTATLTYFYRNPDLQVGEYQRFFSLRSAAENWVEQFKSRNVMVHVNTKKPADSVLLEADLEAIRLRPAPAIEDALRLEKMPKLTRGYRLLSAVSEMVGMVGLAVCATIFCVCLRSGGEPASAWILWTVGSMLAFAALSMWLVIIRAEDEDEYHSISNRYVFWCPPWIRWGLRIGAGAFLVFWLLAKIDPSLAKYLLMGTGTLLPSIWLGWGFLVTTGFHLAIMRSQGQSSPALSEHSS